MLQVVLSSPTTMMETILKSPFREPLLQRALPLLKRFTGLYAQRSGSHEVNATTGENVDTNGGFLLIHLAEVLKWLVVEPDMSWLKNKEM